MEILKLVVIAGDPIQIIRVPGLSEVMIGALIILEEPRWNGCKGSSEYRGDNSISRG